MQKFILKPGLKIYVKSKFRDTLRFLSFYWIIFIMIPAFFGFNSTGVILEGSTMGLGLRRFSIRLCHCVGRPTKIPSFAS